MSSHALDMARGERFAFGANWTRFLAHLTDARIAEAEGSLREMLGVGTLTGLTFLDIGSGSGLFSLAARRLGATVRSFDFDPQSVACTRELRRRFFPDDPDWVVSEGSVLDEQFIRALPPSDVVYSWGVLHHTGAMRQALAHAALPVRRGGTLFIAIYNHQVYWTRYYAALKRAYVALPAPLRWIISGPYVAIQLGKGLIKDVVLLRNPSARYRDKIRSRGMSMWHDWIDWIGGYPFEAATPEEIFEFYRQRGFALRRLVTCGGGHGCNEFVFERVTGGDTPAD